MKSLRLFLPLFSVFGKVPIKKTLFPLKNTKYTLQDCKKSVLIVLYTVMLLTQANKSKTDPLPYAKGKVVINNLRRHLNELSTDEGTRIRKKNGKRICH